MPLLVIALTAACTSFLIAHFSKCKFIGLTGGISSGKSTASKYLKEHHKYAIIDFDIVAREVVQPGKPTLDAIKQLFGDNVINSDGTLNRQLLGEICFSSTEKRIKLNKLYRWPIIKQFILHAVYLLLHGNFEIILDVPLLFESRFYKICHQTLLIYISENIQCQRLIERDNINQEMADKKIHSQWSMEKKKLLSDDIIVNNSDIQHLYSELDNWVIQHNEWNQKNLLFPSIPTIAITTVATLTTCVVYGIIRLLQCSIRKM